MSRIKQDDQRKDKHGLYRRVKKWELSELRLIDGKSADTEVGRFNDNVMILTRFDKIATFSFFIFINLFYLLLSRYTCTCTYHSPSPPSLSLYLSLSLPLQVPEFDLHFEKTTFKWVASNVVEKKAFVVCLYRMAHKYLPRNKPEFIHFDEERLHELLATAEAGGRGREIEEEAVQQGKGEE